MTKNWAVIRRKMMAKDMQELADKVKKRNAEASVAPAEPKKPPKKPTKVEYKKLLAEHDWDYDHSDDYSAWKKGSEQKKALQAMQVVLDPDMVIWKKYESRGRK